MYFLICPGFHSAHLTQSFLQEMALFQWGKVLVFPTDIYPAYSGLEIYHFLQQNITFSGQKKEDVVIIAFSAGVVGAVEMVARSHIFKTPQYTLQKLIALDGWGVPTLGNFPVYRLSHDSFTHWSSKLLGPGQDSFYADPPVEHLTLWESPGRVWGWWETGLGMKHRCTAKGFILDGVIGDG